MEFYKELNQRFMEYSLNNPTDDSKMTYSIKIKADSGCYDRSCCPYAFSIIDEKLFGEHEKDYLYQKHESGPEIITYLALTVAGLGVAKSVIELVTTIIKARFEGQKKGDRHKGEPITLILRTTTRKDEVIEEKIVTFNEESAITQEMVHKLLEDGCKKIEEKVMPKKMK